MGIRQRNYWLQQSEAMKRQLIAIISYGVRIGMAESSDYQKATDSLELSRTEEESSKMSADATWDMLLAMKEGSGV